ncbi:uncharacterized protein LOC105201032 [Solenopsis invicta]|uniref:uncharacterized protein LOC105201032 n=1 Tax=Solenopsis invicta TaxID=13686 RepID=UPI00193C92AF|nr:uncharacterized protein LOC105201032 [Solenopsis invicta]
MVKERAQAISIANRYFMLADEMAPNFKDHLTEHVVLKWFGQVIKGKENVAAFLLSNEIKTFHTFSDIMPISDISYKQSNRKIKRSLDQNAKCETYTSNYLREAPAISSHEIEMSMTCENVKDYDKKSNANDRAVIHNAASNEYESQKYLDKHLDDNLEQYLEDKLRIFADRDDVNVITDVNKNELSANAIAGMDGKSYSLNKNDLCNLFEPEIMSQPIVGKIQNINRIKLKEEMAPTIRAINRECGQGDGPVTEANATKYLEANGEIKFVQMAAQADSLFLYHWSKLGKKKYWTRQCKLQIAYSLIDNCSPTVTRKCYSAQENACEQAEARMSDLSAKVRHDANEIQKSKVPSLEEAIQASNISIQDVNNFGGYLKPLNFLEDRENFLKTFEATIKDCDINLRIYCNNNKLICDFLNRKPLEVTYQIHEIVYKRVEANTHSTKINSAGTK